MFVGKEIFEKKDKNNKVIHELKCFISFILAYKLHFLMNYRSQWLAPNRSEFQARINGLVHLSYHCNIVATDNVKT